MNGMSNRISVRRATPGDLDELVRLRVLMDAEDGVAAESAFPATFRDWYAVYGDRFSIIVAELAGRLVGTVWLERVERVPRPSEVVAAALGYVTFTFVEVEHRNAGVGRRMLEFLRDEATAQRHETLIVWPSEKSVSLYHRAGFRPPNELLEQVLRV